VLGTFTVNSPVARMSSSVRRVLRSPIAIVGGVEATTLIQATASVSASSTVPPTTSTAGMGKRRSSAPRRFFTVDRILSRRATVRPRGRFGWWYDYTPTLAHRFGAQCSLDPRERTVVGCANHMGALGADHCENVKEV